MNSQQVSAAAHPTALAGNMDTSLLKILALVFMIADHVGVAFYPDIMELRMIGRIAMPLYAWCLIVGSEYTHNALKYALRLFILGVISQPFNMMALDNPWSKLNILFLLCIAVLAIAGIRKRWHYSQLWAPALCLIAVLVLNIDYGWRGLLFILFLYVNRNSRINLAAAFLAAAIFWGTSSFTVTSIFGMPLTFLNGNIFSPILRLFFHMQAMMWMALPLIMINTHSNIRIPKWMGYSLYPIHLFVLVLVGLCAGIPLSEFISRLGAF